MIRRTPVTRETQPIGYQSSLLVRRPAQQWMIRAIQGLALVLVVVAAPRCIYWGLATFVALFTEMGIREIDRCWEKCGASIVPLVLSAILYVLCSLRVAQEARDA